MIFFKESM